MEYNLNYFNFKKMNNKMLLTNDIGEHIFISNEEFHTLVNRSEILNKEIFEELRNRGFIFTEDKEIFISDMVKKLKNKNGYLFEKTQLHIFVLTGNCNLNCIYCQASSSINNEKNKMMTEEVASKAVDLALDSFSKNITIEFQGGEPLLNFSILKYIVEHSLEKNKVIKKNLNFSLVTNFTIITQEIMDFIINHNIGLSTSLDGNSEVHNFNRPCKGKATHSIVKANIKKFQNEYNYRGKDNLVGAIQTTTRLSLRYHKEIIDDYLDSNINNLFIRPLSPIGIALKNWSKIGYTPDEFLEFYKKSLEYMIELNKKGIKVKENHTAILLKKILGDSNINYMELRSPCGGTIGQVAYNYDGGIYTCDEGRMLAEEEEDSFKIGDVFLSNWESLYNSEITKAVCLSSCLEVIPKCSECVFKPFCGTCPVYNYIEQKTIFAKQPYSYRCKVYEGMLKIIFEFIQGNNDDIMNIFIEWAK